MKKVFIDGGAHIGEAIEVLLDKREDLKGCEVHFFEPNLNLIGRLEDMAKHITEYDVKVYHAALWDKEGEIDFLESIERWSTLASTVVPEMNEIWGLKLDRENPKKVKTVSLSDFINQFDDEDYLVVKLDVEGSEYTIVEDLFKTGTINKINELYLEWHDHFFPHLRNKGNELRGMLAKTNVKVRNDWM
jgi:FkbM family methyltransferase